MFPNWLLRQQKISPGAKLVYARLSQFAGQDGRCFPGQETLGLELAVRPRTVRKYLAELVHHKLIAEQRRGLNRTNRYVFLWHEWMEDAKTLAESPESRVSPPQGRRRASNRAQGRVAMERNVHSVLDRHDCATPERQERAGPDRHVSSSHDQSDHAAPVRNAPSGPIEEENPERESEEAAAAAGGPGHRRKGSPILLAQPVEPSRREIRQPISAEQASSVDALVEATFDQNDAVHLVASTGASLDQVTSAIGRARRLSDAGKLVSRRGWIMAALERGDPPEPAPVTPQLRQADARDRALEERRRESRAERERAEEERISRERDLQALPAAHYEELARAALLRCPEPIRRRVEAKPQRNSYGLQIEMHNLLKMGWRPSERASTSPNGSGDCHSIAPDAHTLSACSNES